MPSNQLTSTLAAEDQKLLACVHCGLCLEACPTYVLTGDENDSPRGRIYLMRAVADGRIANTSPSFERHIDRCLGCRACEPVCPAGVEYGQLLEAARSELSDSRAKRGISYRLLRWTLQHVWLYPARLKFAFATARMFRDTGVVRMLLQSRIARLISPRFEFGLALLESSSPVSLTTAKRDGHEEPDAESVTGLTVPKPAQSSAMLFTGCVGEGLFARVNKASARVLEANGFAVQVPAGQICCGALHAHAGDLAGARTLARKNIQAFDNDDELPIITNAGGCGAMLATYDHLLADEERFAERARKFTARVRDVSQQLHHTQLRQGAKLQVETITYDASCHLLYGQHAGEAPLELLRAIPNLKLIPLEDAARCCGAAGVYNMLEPDMSGEVLQEKLTHIRATGAEILATGNPGCQMQIGAGAQLAGMSLRVCHPVELLDESYERAGFYR